MKTRIFFRYLLFLSIILVLMLSLKREGSLANEKQDPLSVNVRSLISPSTNVFRAGESIRFGAYSNGIKVEIGRASCRERVYVLV